MANGRVAQRTVVPRITKLSLSIRMLLAIAGAIPLGADTVVLVNGDRLTGTVRRLVDGELVLKSKYLGNLSVRWRDVRSISTEAEFSVLMSDGDRHEGRLARRGTTIEVTEAAGEALAVPAESVARMERGSSRRGIATAISAIDGSADIGFSLVGGNQHQTQSSLGAAAEYATAAFSVHGRLDSLFARQDGARSQSRHALTARVDRFLDGRLFAYALSGLERNERRRLDLRSRLGGGFGWQVRRSRDSGLSLLGGLTFVHEQRRDVGGRRSAEVLVGGEWRTRLVGRTSLVTHLTLHHDQVDRRRLRVEFDSGLSIPIAANFKYSLRLFDRFDTRPVSEVKRNDYGIVSGLGVAF